MIGEMLKNSEMLLETSQGRRKVQFTDGCINDSEFTRWYDSSDRLVVVKADGMPIRLSWESEYFQGRDVMGIVRVIPPDCKVWRKVFYPEKPPSQSAATEDVPEVPHIGNMYTRTKDAAIILIGCDRVDYFQTTFASIILNRPSDYDFYVFLDRPANPETQDQLSSLVQDSGVRVIRQPVNRGCGRMLIDARNQVFDMGYDRAFVFEDDLVVGRNYLRFCEDLLDWGQKFGNVGAVQGWNKCLMPTSEKIKKLGEVFATYSNWWGYLITKESWQAMQPVISGYRKFIECEYSRRPVRHILEYFKPFVDRPFKTKLGGFIPDEASIEHRRKLFQNLPSGQDAATWVAFDNAGLVRLAPTVNRAIYIGKLGIHMTTEQYIRERFHRVTLDYDDVSVGSFTPR